MTATYDPTYGATFGATYDPTGRQESAAGPLLDFRTALPTGWTCVRAGDRTYFGADKLLKVAGDNVARIDHDWVTGAQKGVLCEIDGTRRTAEPRDLTGAPWAPAFTTETLTGTGLDGEANACTVVSATAPNGDVSQALTLTAATRTFVAWLKPGTVTGIVRVSADGGTSGWTNVVFNGSEWVRTFHTTTLANPKCVIEIANSGDSVTVDGAQLTDGSYPLYPIFETPATPGTVVPRDLVEGPLAELIATNPIDGVLDFSGERWSDSGTEERLVVLSDGTQNERVILRKASTDRINALIVTGNSTTANMVTATALTGTGPYTIDDHIQIATNDMALQSGSDPIVTDTTNTVPSPLTEGTLASARITSLNNASCWIAQIVYRPGARLQ